MEQLLRRLMPFFKSSPLALAATAMLAMSAISLPLDLPSYIERALYLSHGVEADATVIRKPDACGRGRFGPICIVTYRYADPSGKSFEWTDSINSTLWPKITVGSTVRIVYLDFAPSFSKATELRFLKKAADIINSGMVWDVAFFLFSAGFTWIMYWKYRRKNVDGLLPENAYAPPYASPIPEKLSSISKPAKRGIYLLALSMALGLLSTFFSRYGNVQPVLLIWAMVAGLLAFISMKRKP